MLSRRWVQKASSFRSDMVNRERIFQLCHTPLHRSSESITVSLTSQFTWADETSSNRIGGCNPSSVESQSLNAYSAVVCSISDPRPTGGVLDPRLLTNSLLSDEWRPTCCIFSQWLFISPLPSPRSLSLSHLTDSSFFRKRTTQPNRICSVKRWRYVEKWTYKMTRSEGISRCRLIRRGICCWQLSPFLGTIGHHLIGGSTA